MSIRKATLTEVLMVHNQIAELSAIAGSDYFAARIGDRNYLALAAESDGVLMGYKLGYWLSADVFYSWLGGVLPAYRKQGVAKQLLLEQERYIYEQGGAEIRVKSMNQFKSMLLLLIAQDYKITGTEMIGAEVSKFGEIKIHFSKLLQKK